MARKQLKYKEVMHKMQKLEARAIDIPYKVWTCFWDSKPSLSFSLGQVSFEGDYKTREEIIDALNWLLDQFEDVEITHKDFWKEIELKKGI